LNPAPDVWRFLARVNARTEHVVELPATLTMCDAWWQVRRKFPKGAIHVLREPVRP